MQKQKRTTGSPIRTTSPASDKANNRKLTSSRAAQPSRTTITLRSRRKNSNSAERSGPHTVQEIARLHDRSIRPFDNLEESVSISAAIDQEAVEDPHRRVLAHVGERIHLRADDRANVEKQLKRRNSEFAEDVKKAEKEEGARATL